METIASFAKCGQHKRCGKEHTCPRHVFSLGDVSLFVSTNSICSYTCTICCSFYPSKQLDQEIRRDVQCQLGETNDWTYVIYDGIFFSLHLHFGMKSNTIAGERVLTTESTGNTHALDIRRNKRVAIMQLQQGKAGDSLCKYLLKEKRKFVSHSP